MGVRDLVCSVSGSCESLVGARRVGAERSAGSVTILQR